MIRAAGWITLLSLTSFSAFSSTEIKRSETEKYQHAGHISVSGEHSAEEAMLALHRKTDIAGADVFSVIRLTTSGDGNKWSANAVIYKTR
ncbi:hypothetical protein CIG19_10305 [Enterobacterales bacterium CwR94]|nr:hypothetical protein CIG19_10305 [Enterobacterales bacterium CwR94]